MATVSPQLGIFQTIIIPQAEILTLNTAPVVICPAEPGYINVFSRAVLVYSYRNAVFSNVNNVLSFYLVPGIGSPILVSNSLNGQNILGLDQNTTSTYISANPYTPQMSLSDNASLLLTIADSNPTGGDPLSILSVVITYNVFEL